MILALLLTNPDGSPMGSMDGPNTFARTVGHEAAVAAMIATASVGFVAAIVWLTCPENRPARFPKGFAYLIAATVELWIFAMFGPLLLR